MGKNTNINKETWEQYVPIIKTKGKSGDVYDIYLQDEIQSPAMYNEVCYTINKAKRKDKVNLHINTPGGYLDTAFRLTEAIDRCKATTVAFLTGTVASAGTIIALRCDEVDAPKSLQFMIHNYSGGTAGKGNEIIDHVTFSNKEITKAFNSIYLGFLNKKEVRKVIAGKDFWMGAEEVVARWAKMKKRQKRGK